MEKDELNFDKDFKVVGDSPSADTYLIYNWIC